MVDLKDIQRLYAGEFLGWVPDIIRTPFSIITSMSAVDKYGARLLKNIGVATTHRAGWGVYVDPVTRWNSFEYAKDEEIAAFWQNRELAYKVRCVYVFKRFAIAMFDYGGLFHNNFLIHDRWIPLSTLTQLPTPLKPSAPSVTSVPVTPASF